MQLPFEGLGISIIPLPKYRTNTAGRRNLGIGPYRKSKEYRQDCNIRKLISFRQRHTEASLCKWVAPRADLAPIILSNLLLTALGLQQLGASLVAPGVGRARAPNSDVRYDPFGSKSELKVERRPSAKRWVFYDGSAEIMMGVGP
jgi:hypothetical protein